MSAQKNEELHHIFTDDTMRIELFEKIAYETKISFMKNGSFCDGITQAAEQDSLVNGFFDLATLKNLKAIGLNKNTYTAYLKVKYTYFLSVIQSRKGDLLNECDFLSSGTKEKYRKLFDIWNDEYVFAESRVLLLRYNQIGECALNRWYNDLNEFKIWFEYLCENPGVISELESLDMGKNSDHISIQEESPKLNKVIKECTAKILALLSSGVRNEDNLLQEFIIIIRDVFDAKLTDHMKIYDDGKCVRYNAVSDKSISGINNKELEKNESYMLGEGITGSILLWNELTEEERATFHVGTNCISNDERQSDEHKNTYTEIYGKEINTFWSFPYFDEKRKIKGVFRVVNKQHGENVWHYEERADLILVARWFETFWGNILNILHPENKFIFSDAKIEEIYKRLDMPWIDEPFFDLLLTHLKTTVHKKIENLDMGVGTMIFDEMQTRKYKQGKPYPIFPMQPWFYKGNVSIPFNVEDPIKVDTNTTALRDIGLMYKTMNTLISFCLYSSEGKFYGIRHVSLTKNETPNINKIIQITKDGDSLFFLTKGEEKSIKVYKDGSFFLDYYLSESDGDWRVRLFSEYEKVLKEKAKVASTLPKSICELIFELSSRQIGSMIIFANKRIEEFTVNDENHNKIENEYITNKNIAELSSWASLDGAVICNSNDGEILYAGTILHGITNTNINIDPIYQKLKTFIKTHQKGSRHTAAAQYTMENPDDCVIVISQNKGISVFIGGEIIIGDDKIM